jgi:hypothetical protein
MTDTALDAALAQQNKLGYWGARKSMLYYKAIYYFAAVAGYDAKTVLDVGSGGTDYINWLDWIPRRYVLDFHVPKPPPGVEAINTDFLQFRPAEKFDLVLCCQVLEHVSEPRLFCDRLRDIAKQLIISVPYKWLGNAPGHINDPDDEAKLEGWMQIKPNNSQVIYEPFREGRLIAYYHLVEGPRFRFPKEFIISALAERTAER